MRCKCTLRLSISDTTCIAASVVVVVVAAAAAEHLRRAMRSVYSMLMMQR